MGRRSDSMTLIVPSPNLVFFLLSPCLGPSHAKGPHLHYFHGWPLGISWGPLATGWEMLSLRNLSFLLFMRSEKGHNHFIVSVFIAIVSQFPGNPNKTHERSNFGSEEWPPQPYRRAFLFLSWRKWHCMYTSVRRLWQWPQNALPGRDLLTCTVKNLVTCPPTTALTGDSWPLTRQEGKQVTLTCFLAPCHQLVPLYPLPHSSQCPHCWK